MVWVSQSHSLLENYLASYGKLLLFCISNRPHFWKKNDVTIPVGNLYLHFFRSPEWMELQQVEKPADRSSKGGTSTLSWCQVAEAVEDVRNFVRKLVVSTLAPEPVDPGFTGFLWLPIRKIDHVEVFLGSSKDNMSLAHGSLDQSCQSFKETKQHTVDSLWKGGKNHLQLHIFEGTKYFFKDVCCATPRSSKKWYEIIKNYIHQCHWIKYIKYPTFLKVSYSHALEASLPKVVPLVCWDRLDLPKPNCKSCFLRKDRPNEGGRRAARRKLVMEWQNSNRQKSWLMGS